MSHGVNEEPAPELKLFAVPLIVYVNARSEEQAKDLIARDVQAPANQSRDIQICYQAEDISPTEVEHAKCARFRVIWGYLFRRGRQ